MCNNNERDERCNCFRDTLRLIIKLQRKGDKIDDIPQTCDRPFLGNITPCIVPNTRPVTFYTCANDTLITMPYTLNGQTCTSSVFRVEQVEGCCATCRVLAPSNEVIDGCETTYQATDSFFTINLNCCGILKCLPDTYIACI